MPEIRRIVVASDFSNASRKAFTTAVSLAKSLRAELTVVHVIAPFTPIAPEQYVYTEAWQRMDRDARQWGQQQLRRLTDRARKAGVRTGGRVLSGDPGREITKAARSLRAGLLVVGTHGRTGLTRFFVGSVASRIVATASCPVVTVRNTR